jgi:hypothetical protein
MRLLNAVDDPDAELLANIERPSGAPGNGPTESPIQIFATQTKLSNGHRLSGAVSGRRPFSLDTKPFSSAGSARTRALWRTRDFDGADKPLSIKPRDGVIRLRHRFCDPVNGEWKVSVRLLSRRGRRGMLPTAGCRPLTILMGFDARSSNRVVM